MAKDIFMADYSSCRQTNREITSNGSYLDDILDLINKGDGYISTAGGRFNKGTYNALLSQIKTYISQEKNRYGSFYTAFEDFHTPLEDIDAGLAQMLNSQLDNVKKNNNYDSYVAVINSNEQGNLETSLYYYFLEQGLSNEKALAFSAMGDEETAELIKKYSEMSPGEFETAIQELKKKADKSLPELFIYEICQFNKPDSDLDLLKDITEKYAKNGTWVSIVESKLLDRSLGQAKLDVNSLTGQLTKLQNQIRTSQLSQVKIDAMNAEYTRLKILRDERMQKVATVESTPKTIATITKCLGVAVKVYQVGKIGYDEYKAFTEEGVELDDCIVTAGLEWGGICTSAAAGSAIGKSVGGWAGTIVGPGPATAIGIVVGIAAGAAVGVLYDTIAKPVGTFVYENVLESAGEWISDRENDIGDWWDSLWW